jgi:phosphonate transport system permease protein
MGLRGYTLAFALYTHIRRQIISSVLFMLEYNVRTASILGFVGAGGVGYYILQYLDILDYQAALTFVIAAIAIVAAIDTTSYTLRTRI